MTRKRRVLEVAKTLFRAKETRRLALAKLPFEKKIQLLAELQKMSGRPA